MKLPAALLLAVALAGGGFGPGTVVPSAPRQPAGAPPHPAALSVLLVDVGDDAVRLTLRMQELTLRETPRFAFDDDADGYFSTVELADHWSEVQAYLEEKLWLTLDDEEWSPLWTIEGFDEVGGALPGGGSRFETMTAVAERAVPRRPERVAVHCDLFLEDGNPAHRCHVVVRGLGAGPQEALLSYGVRDWEAELPSSRSVLVSYLELGTHHVLEGLDHLAFLAALLLGIASLRALVGAVTAFTVAHSITLALAALDVLALPPALVEPGIALSIVWVLMLETMRPGHHLARPWLPAFAFGLLHGFGFAGVLGEIGLPAGRHPTALLGFNLGVEAGQLAFVVPAALALLGLRRLVGREREPVLGQALLLVVLALGERLLGDAALTWWLEPRGPFAGPATSAVTLTAARIGIGLAGGFVAALAAAAVMRQRRGALRAASGPLLQAAALLASYEVGVALA